MALSRQRQSVVLRCAARRGKRRPQNLRTQPADTAGERLHAGAESREGLSGRRKAAGEETTRGARPPARPQPPQHLLRGAEGSGKRRAGCQPRWCRGRPSGEVWEDPKARGDPRVRGQELQSSVSSLTYKHHWSASARGDAACAPAWLRAPSGEGGRERKKPELAASQDLMGVCGTQGVKSEGVKGEDETQSASPAPPLLSDVS